MEWLAEGPGRKSLLREKREKAIRVCRDVYEGTLHMRDRAEEYLPAFAKEEPAQHSRRVSGAVLFPALKRTVRGLTGMVLRKEPKVADVVPEGIRAHLADVDRGGRDLATFANDAFNEGWVDGLSIIFVDMPPVKEGAPRDEARGARPYWVVVRADDVLGAQTMRRDGAEVVASIRWRETAIVRGDDDFHEKEVARVREYSLVEVAEEGGEMRTRVQWRLWELQLQEGGKKLEWIPVGQPELMGRQMDEIPLAVIHTDRASLLDAAPPLTDLALENVRHFQKSSDKDNIEHVSAVPIFFTKGIDADDLKGFSVGPAVGLAAPSADADAKYVETTGEGAAINADALKDSERRMALQGLSMLYTETRAPETLGSKRIDKAESDSQLVTAAKSLEKALETAISLHAKWLGIEISAPDGDAGLVEINRDYENLRLDAQTIQVLGDLVPGKLSLETFWALLVQGEILPENHDPELERGRLETEDIDALAALAAARRAASGGTEGDDGDEE